MAASRHRIFTCYIRKELEGIEESPLKPFADHCLWYIGQDEIGNHGLPHIQLMFGFKNAKTVSAAQKLLNNFNIEPVHDTMATYKYVTDETKRDPHGETYSFGDIPSFKKKMNDSLIDKALNEKTYEQAMSLIENEDKLYYINHQKQLSLYFTQKFSTGDTAHYNISQFTQKPYTEWLKTHVLVFIGETGIGKTQFSLAHFKNPLLIRDKED